VIDDLTEVAHLEALHPEAHRGHLINNQRKSTRAPGPQTQ
jgi:hypothetical protein